MGPRSKFVNSGSDEIAQLAHTKDRQSLAIWAADCADRVLNLFEAHYRDDARPRDAIKAARGWAAGTVGVADARTRAFAAHASARQASSEGRMESAFAARAAGQAAATAHVAGHAVHAATYAAKAVYYNALLLGRSENAEETPKQQQQQDDASAQNRARAAVECEREWQTEQAGQVW